MEYIDSSLRHEAQTVAYWMDQNVRKGVSEFRCQAGYFTLEGTSVLLSSIMACAKEGAQVSLLLGSNNGVTLASHVSYLAGALGLPAANVNLGVVRFANALFHPKVYVFSRPDGSMTAYVGSANMTAPGVSGRNVEAGIILDSADGDDIGFINGISDRIDFWFQNKSEGLFHVDGPEDIEEMLENGALALVSTRSTPLHDADDKSENPKPNAAAPLRRSAVALPRLPSGALVEGHISTPVSSLPEPMFNKLTARTEASYHYPQGTHLGHILSILHYFSVDRSGTPFDDDFIRLKGGFGSGRKAGFRRQIKYKLLAAIELGLVSDIRLVDDVSDYSPTLTNRGRDLWQLLSQHIDTQVLQFQIADGGVYSSTMPLPATDYNRLVLDATANSAELKNLYSETFLSMPAVSQMREYLITLGIGVEHLKRDVYSDFFQFKPVVTFCDLVGIEPATPEAAKRRCPFLINVLESLGVASQSASYVEISED